MRKNNKTGPPTPWRLVPQEAINEIEVVCNYGHRLDTQLLIEEEGIPPNGPDDCMSDSGSTSEEKFLAEKLQKAFKTFEWTVFFGYLALFAYQLYSLQLLKAWATLMSALSYLRSIVRSRMDHK